MRITFIIPCDDLSGGIRVVATYAEKLRARGHVVSIVAPHPTYPTLWQQFKKIVRGKRVAKQRSPRESHFSRIGMPVVFAAAERIQDGTAVPNGDVVIATWWETAHWVSGLGSEKGKKHYFVQGHEVFAYCPIDRVRQSYRLPLQKIVIAKWLQDLMRDEYGDDQAVLVPNAVDHALFHAAARGKQAQPTIGFVCAESPLKAMDVAIGVIERLRKTYPKLRVVSFGGGFPTSFSPQKQDIEFVASPPQDTIREIYASCDAWLVTSRAEGFCLPAIEAMACRTPVVSTRMGWPAEAIIDGQNGMLAAVDDVAGLVQGISAILDNSESAWRMMSDNAFRTVMSSSWDKSAELFEQALLESQGGLTNDNQVTLAHTSRNLLHGHV